MISTERLDELRTEVGDDDFAEIVDLFISESDSIVAQLAGIADAAAGDELLHTLKGSALNLGFTTLAGLCREGEGAAAGSAGWAARITRITEVYEQSKAGLRALT